MRVGGMGLRVQQVLFLPIFEPQLVGVADGGAKVEPVHCVDVGGGAGETDAVHLQCSPEASSVMIN